MNYFALLNDLQDIPHQAQNDGMMNEKEIELMKKIKEMGDDVVEESGMGIIGMDMPHAYYNVICFYIGYKTGTSLKHIMDMNLFDLISYMYMVRKVSEQGGDSGENTPTGREVRDTLGG